MTLSYYFTRGAWLIVLVLGLAHPAFAQLTLDAFSPTDGATDVNTTATVAFTFSAALDTETLFEGDIFPFDDFFLNLEIDPDPGVPLDVRVGDDGQTVAIDFQLEEDTKYQVILEGAFSTTGAGLNRPHEFTFTTGDALPRGTVSGTITFDGGDPTGTVVTIFRSESGNPAFEDDTEAAAIVMDPSGAYTADFVSGGDYVVAAFKDLNGDGVADDPLEDALRAYDGDGDSVVDVLTVGDGENVDDIDLSIQVLDRSTARGPFLFAQTLARLAAPDAHLSLVLTEVTPEGTSPTWVYGFYSPATQDTLGLFAIGDQFAFEPDVLEDDERDGEDEGFLFDLTTPLPEDWIDSDVAVDSAEARGGADFRAANPDAQITTFLANLPEELCVLFGTVGRTDLILPADRSPGALSTKIAQLAGKTAATAAAKAYWLVFYFPQNELSFPFGLCIDAVTGGPPPARELTTAKSNQETANEAARAWAADAQLVAVGTTPEGLDSTGMALNWVFAYHSPAMGQAQNFIVSDSLVLGQADLDPVDLSSFDPLPENWIDSSVAASVAEANSFDFRNQHADAVVFAVLSRGQVNRNRERAVWRFTYLSQRDNALQIVTVDAETGMAVRVVEEPGVPSTFVLEQNYPNPFNPETRIPFGLAHAGHVTLTVYNVLGQHVATLIDQFLPAGSYSFAWQPNTLPSGLYLYQLKTNDVVLSRTMTLLR